MNDRLDVYCGDQLAGHITRYADQTIFSYVSDFPGTNLPGRGIAFNLPRERGPFVTPGATLHPFFANLLPEGIRLQKLQEHHLDGFSLLRQTGGDAIGDVTVVPSGAALPIFSPVPAYRLAETDFLELLDQNTEAGTTLPGVQEKLSSNAVSFPGPSGAEPAILKLASPKFANLVENEHFFMEAARKCGIETAECLLARDRSGRTGLLVRRFDRRQGQKVHQEDGCQILNAYPDAKTAPTVRQLLEAIEGVASTSPSPMAKVLQIVAFSYLIGNSDLHSKKLSVYFSPRGFWEISPAYGLLSTLPYSKLNRNMALKISGRDDNFQGKDFQAFFAQFRMPPQVCRSILVEIIDSASSWIADLDRIGFDRPKTNSLRLSIEARRERLASFSKPRALGHNRRRFATWTAG